MQERRINYRPSFNWTAQNNVSANFYPVVSAIAIRDLEEETGDIKGQMTVLNDKSQAGSACLKRGRIELI